jgi:hypothetical protein
VAGKTPSFSVGRDSADASPHYGERELRIILVESNYLVRCTRTELLIYAKLSATAPGHIDQLPDPSELETSCFYTLGRTLSGYIDNEVSAEISPDFDFLWPTGAVVLHAKS